MAAASRNSCRRRSPSLVIVSPFGPSPQDVVRGPGPLVLDQMLDLHRVEPGPEVLAEIVDARTHPARSNFGPVVAHVVTQERFREPGVALGARVVEILAQAFHTAAPGPACAAPSWSPGESGVSKYPLATVQM